MENIFGNIDRLKNFSGGKTPLPEAAKSRGCLNPNERGDESERRSGFRIHKRLMGGFQSVDSPDGSKDFVKSLHELIDHHADRDECVDKNTFQYFHYLTPCLDIGVVLLHHCIIQVLLCFK